MARTQEDLPRQGGRCDTDVGQGSGTTVSLNNDKNTPQLAATELIRLKERNNMSAT